MEILDTIQSAKRPTFVYELVIHHVPASWVWPNRPDGWEEAMVDHGMVDEHGEPLGSPLGMLSRRNYLTKKAAVKKANRMRRYGATVDILRWSVCDPEMIP